MEFEFFQLNNMSKKLRCLKSLEDCTPDGIKCMILSYLVLQDHIKLSTCNKNWHYASTRKESKIPGSYKIISNHSTITTWLDRLVPHRPSSIIMNEIQTNDDIAHYVTAPLSKMHETLRSLTTLTFPAIYTTDEKSDIKWCSQVTSFIIEEDSELEQITYFSPQALKLFTNLQLYHGRISSGSIETLPISLTSLDTHYSNIMLERTALMTILSRFTSLTHFDCTGDWSYTVYLSLFTHPSLTSIGISIWCSLGQSMLQLILNELNTQKITNHVFNRLKTLDLFNSHLRNSFIKILLSMTPQLTFLHASHLTRMDDLNFLSTVVPKLPRLSSLHIWCSPSFHIFHLKSFSHVIKSLTIHCSNLTNLDSISQLIHLEKLIVITDQNKNHFLNQIRCYQSFPNHPKLRYLNMELSRSRKSVV